MEWICIINKIVTDPQEEMVEFFMILISVSVN